MKHLTLAVILCLILLPAVARAVDDGYGYPIPGSYDATILGTPDNFKPPPPAKISVRQLVFDIIPDLKKPDIFFYDEGLRCTLAYQDKKAPLVFASGAGAAGRFNMGLVITTGIAIGTLFTLFVVPAMYMFLAAEHTGRQASEDATGTEPAMV
jgi:hypothetical protein